MTMRKERFLLALLAAAATLIVGASLALAASRNSPTAGARAATARYHDISLAIADGYGEFRDAAGIACIDQPGVGAMGVHYVNGALVGDTVLDPTRPEALVYEPRKYTGGFKLVALEYIVFKDAWDATHSSPPSLFGQELMVTPSPNRFGIPAFYALHAWLFRGNPLGQLQPWNPRVSC
jgi:hypothetical protein